MINRSLLMIQAVAAVALCLVGPSLRSAAGSPGDSASSGGGGGGGGDVGAVLENPADWSVKGTGTVNNAWPIEPVKGRVAISPKPGGAELTSRNALTGEMEVTALLHFGSPDNKGSFVTVEAGLKEGPPAKEAFEVSMSRPAVAPASPPTTIDTLSWSVPTLDGWKNHGGEYVLWSLPPGRVVWPRAVRLQVLQDFSGTPHLEQKWVALRVVLRKHAVQAYLDGRLIHDGASPTVDTNGQIRVTVGYGAAVASLRVRPLGPEDPRFDLVELDHYVNSATFAGQPVAVGLPPDGHGTVHVGRVPMQLPRADAKGNNHIDLSGSWNRYGFLAGESDAMERWAGALSPDPARMQLRLRPARYTKLHLLAAWDGAPNTVPVVSAQFYRSAAGHPINFSTQAPLYTATSKAGDAVPIRLADGKQGNLFLLTIPLEPNNLSRFADDDAVDLELTNQVHIWRSFPEPDYFSFHSGGLPSGVQVFGVTLERPAVDVDIQPDRFAHVWVAPEQPSYTVTLRNATNQAQTERLTLGTASQDESELTGQEQKVTVPPLGKQVIKFSLRLEKYGHHNIELLIKDGDGVRRVERSLALLHPDTRERGNWEEGKGILYGFWDWNGGHVTPSGMPRLQLAYDLGIESREGPMTDMSKEEREWCAQHGMATHYLAYEFSPGKGSMGVDWDPTKPDVMAKAVVEAIKKSPYSKPEPWNKPELAALLAEPAEGLVSYLSLPEYYGEPPYEMTAFEKQKHEEYLSFLLIAGKAIKTEWPNARILWPYGTPNFMIPFLHDKQAAELMDGPAVDMAPFERLPEMQMGDFTLHAQMWQVQQEWKKRSTKPWPRLTTIEGPCVVNVLAGSLNQEQVAQLTNRTFLTLMAYNVTQFNGWPSLAACAGYWGENGYGGGLCMELPELSPGVALSSFATMTRHINRMNFVKAVPTGSSTVFCYQFKHYTPGSDGELLHVFWTLNGKRPVSVAVGADERVAVFDSMDNEPPVSRPGGQAKFTITTAPCFVHGLKGDAKVTLGEPDHSDARPAQGAEKLTNVGDWHQVTEARDAREDYYETVHGDFLRRFPGAMSVSVAHAPRNPRNAGHQALAVHLEKQAKDRFVMPYYTELAPKRPIIIPGRASHLGIWVKGSSDWGRVVYFLRDAKGQPWISVGTKGAFSNDDARVWSQFNFDGWRYLRFELPANAPWDNYREPGRIWWGGPGVDDNTVVELPLTLEKIAVERRTHVIYVNELVPANPADVLLGDVYAEYDSADDNDPKPVIASKVRRPLANPPGGDDAVTMLLKQGTDDTHLIERVALPAGGEDDGKTCLVYTKALPGGWFWGPSKYCLWVAPTPDGKGAVEVEKDWSVAGQTLTGMSPDKDFYLFAVFLDGNGTQSKVSPPFKVNLAEMHKQK